jgi:hypothetical protein
MANSGYETSFWETLWEFIPGIVKSLAVVTLVFTIFQVISLGYSSQSNNNTTSDAWIPEYSVRVGPSDAKVTLVYFVDLQCPACKQNDPELQRVQDQYQDRVQFVYRHLPLDIHAYAVLAARGAQAMAREGNDNYFEYKRQIFVSQTDLSPDKIQEVGRSLSQDFDQWNRLRNSRSIDQEVQQDKNFIQNRTLPPSSLNNQATRTTGTPTSIILKNDEVVDWWSGGLSSQEQSNILEKHLNEEN